MQLSELKTPKKFKENERDSKPPTIRKQNVSFTHRIVQNRFEDTNGWATLARLRCLSVSEIQPCLSRHNFRCCKGEHFHQMGFPTRPAIALDYWCPVVDLKTMARSCVSNMIFSVTEIPQHSSNSASCAPPCVTKMSTAATCSWTFAAASLRDMRSEVPNSKRFLFLFSYLSEKETFKLMNLTAYLKLGGGICGSTAEFFSSTLITIFSRKHSP